MSNWRTLSRSLGAVRGSHAKGGRAALRFGGGRTDLLEELGRVEGERSNPNRRAEISRVHSELNRGYAKGGRAGFKHGGSKKSWKHHDKVAAEAAHDLAKRGKKQKTFFWKGHRIADTAEERKKFTDKKADGGRIGFKKGTDKKWIQKATASIKKRGTKGKCTPITKPGCTGRAKALAKTFKKMAKKRKG